MAKSKVSGAKYVTYIEMTKRGTLYCQSISARLSKRDSVVKKKLEPCSEMEMLADVNTGVNKRRYAIWVGILITGIVFYLIFFSPLNVYEPRFVLTVGIWLVAVVAVSLVDRWERAQRITALIYKVDDRVKTSFADFNQGIQNLENAQYLWHVTSRDYHYDWKRNAGAVADITRRRSKARFEASPFIVTNVRIFSLILDHIRILFFPDQMLIFQPKGYSSIKYQDLRVEVGTTRFVESQVVPGDAIILEYTWRYVRKDGGPDLRFSNNRQLPVLQYAYLELASGSGLDVSFHVSNVTYAKQFAQALTSYARQLTLATGQAHEASKKDTSEKQKWTSPQATNANDPYLILQVPYSATEEEIVAAYRRMAQMYHPDKVATMAPEFKELADTRMKELNSAYAQLKLKFK
jgi:hypothetical protein